MNVHLPKLTFTVQVFREGKQYVSFNPELRVASCGKTLEEAKNFLRDLEVKPPSPSIKELPVLFLRLYVILMI